MILFNSALKKVLALSVLRGLYRSRDMCESFQNFNKLDYRSISILVHINGYFFKLYVNACLKNVVIMEYVYYVSLYIK